VQRRDRLMLDETQPSSIFHCLGIAVFQPVGRLALTLLNPAPAWLERALPENVTVHDQIQIDSAFPFLTSFLTEAGEFWENPGSNRLISEIWTQDDRSGNNLPLQASAIASYGARFLLVQLVDDEYAWRWRTSQLSRERGLQLESQDRETEQRLFYAYQQIAALVTNSPLAVIEFDPELRITAWTGAAEQVFGWEPGEVIGKKLNDWRFVHEDDWIFVLDAIENVRKSGSFVSSSRNYRKDGALIYCEWYNSAVFDKRGRLISALSMALDTTDRRESEQALRASEEKFRSIFEAAPVGVFQSNAAGCLLNVNARMASMFGFDHPAEMVASVGNTIEELYVDAARRHRILGRALRAGDFVRETLEARRRDGTVVTTNLFLRAWPTTRGDVVGIEGFIEDITARVQAERELQEAHDELEQRVLERTEELSRANERLQELDRLKSQFLANMSHELRTPLNSIIGFTSLIRKKMAGPVTDVQEKQLDIVLNSSRHLLSLINDLLDVSRIEAGGADLHCERFDFNGVVEEAIATVRPFAQKKGIELMHTPGPVAIEITTDRQRSFQVVLNLLNNAVKFTDAGCVGIEATIENCRLRVTVSDTGIGISPDQIPRLFEAFRQVDSSARRAHEGTGLGLYLCRKLLDLMSGEISVESEFGQGSRFIFTLPLVRPFVSAEAALLPEDVACAAEHS
jgi:PAS domain S-box-containing protein